jgi:hypothetical protein
MSPWIERTGMELSDLFGARSNSRLGTVVGVIFAAVAVFGVVVLDWDPSFGGGGPLQTAAGVVAALAAAALILRDRL